MVTTEEIQEGYYSFELDLEFNEVEATGYFIHNLLPEAIEVCLQDKNYIEIKLQNGAIYSAIIKKGGDSFSFVVNFEFIH